MREVIKYIKFITGDFVICGSMALYLHNIIEDYNPNEIDIIVDLPNRDLDSIRILQVIHQIDLVLEVGLQNMVTCI